MARPLDYSLYLATDRRFLTGTLLSKAVAAAVANGVTVVQLREKDATGRDVYETAVRVHRVCRKHGVPLIINDRLDIMLAVGAEGIHVGRQDIPLDIVRRLAPDRIVGYSVNALGDLRYAEETGADYVGVGPVFTTPTKTDTGPALGIDGIRSIVAAASIPCVAIGGINAANAGAVAATGVAGIAVISAILAQPDIAATTHALRTAFDTGKCG